jgi:hypothetical protein
MKKCSSVFPDDFQVIFFSILSVTSNGRMIHQSPAAARAGLVYPAGLWHGIHLNPPASCLLPAQAA